MLYTHYGKGIPTPYRYLLFLASLEGLGLPVKPTVAVGDAHGVEVFEAEFVGHLPGASPQLLALTLVGGAGTVKTEGLKGRDGGS